jgi:hypothetical protein
MVNKGSCSRERCQFLYDKRVIAEAKAENVARHADRFNKGFFTQPPKELPPDHAALLVDSALLAQYPSLLSRTTAEATTAGFAYLINQYFYDPADNQFYLVTRVKTKKKN